MPFEILTSAAASITELKRDPMGTFKSGEGEAVLILNRNEPAFYCVSPKMFSYLIELADDETLHRLIKQREGEEKISVDFSDL